MDDIESLKLENEKLKKSIKTLRAKIKRGYEKQEVLIEEINELDVLADTNIVKSQPVKKLNACKSCGATVEYLKMPTGTLKLCTICLKREFVK